MHRFRGLWPACALVLVVIDLPLGALDSRSVVALRNRGATVSLRAGIDRDARYARYNVARLRGGSDLYMEDDDGMQHFNDEPAEMAIEDLPPSAALVPQKRLNITALDMTVQNSDAIGEASAMAAMGIDEHHLDQRVEEVLNKLADLDLTDPRNQRFDGLPVQQPHESVLVEEDIVRRGAAGELTEQEQDDLRARGKSYLIPDIDNFCPPREGTRAL
jgi:hypothetical protein